MAEERCCRSRRRQWKQAAVSAVVSVSDQWVVSRSSGLCHGPAVLVLIRWVSPIFRWFVSLSDEFSRCCRLTDYCTCFWFKFGTFGFAGQVPGPVNSVQFRQGPVRSDLSASETVRVDSVNSAS
ncbi:hypothetical protein HanPSC8_Chr03g0098291 [Helianthus annuus]|nr:hypothetical protein HanIR_Chr03g0111071 [Helianthus annuus]KAJ0942953.1 hypothetical protein HanPSC8_Chr03g0098291 [Helianthus annuus]